MKELQKRQIIREDRGYAKKLGYLKYGGYTLPKYYYGGAFLNGNGSTTNLPFLQRQPKELGVNVQTPKIQYQPYSNIPSSPSIDSSNIGQMIGTGLGLVGNAIEVGGGRKPNKGRTVGSGILKGAGTGASIGSAAGPWGTLIGGVVGAVGGAIGGGNRARREQEEWDKIQAIQDSNFKDLQMNRSSYMYRQFNPYIYKYGGKIVNNPQFEVEKGEIVRGDNINLTNSNRVSSNI